jgi:hypothetical protein
MRPKAGAVADTLWPPPGERRTLVIALWLPLLLPVLMTVATDARTTPLWTMCNWTLLPAVLLSSPLLDQDERATTRALAFALAWPVIAVAASPFVAVAVHRAGIPHSAAHYRLLAGEVERAWRNATERPLRVLGGQSDLAFGAAFYLPEPPLVLSEIRALSPWIDDAMLMHDGIAFICSVDYAQCVVEAETYARQHGGVRRTDVELARRYFGMPAPAERFVIVAVAPQP